MLKYYLSFIALCFLNGQLLAQCPSGDVILETQAELDAFVETYPNCTEIEGDLFIGDLFGSDINDISGLSALTSVGGGLYVAVCPELTTLSGLDGITTVGDWLAISANDALTSLSSLSSVTSVGGTLTVGGCDALTTLSGLDAVTFVGESLIIDDNPNLISLASLSGIPAIDKDLRIRGNHSLASLSGLNAVSSVGGHLLISNNAGLVSLSGLEALASVGSFLTIGFNINLTSLSGLNALVFVGEGLEIRSNNALVSLSGLSALSSIGGELSIRFNNILPSLQGLEGIDPAGITALTIRDNWELSICAIENVCTYLETENGLADILDNSSGCGTRTEVEDACNTSMTGDLCFDAISIDYLFGQNTGQPQTSALLDNTGNTTNDTPAEGFECHEQADAISNSLWVSFTGDGNTYRITTIQCAATGDTYLDDTQMALYRGNCSVFSPVACNDNQDIDQDLLNAELFLDTDINADYLLLLDGYAGAVGEFCLEVTQIVPVATTDIASTPIEVFPNPTNGRLQIRNITAEEIIILNSQGLRIASYETPGNELDLSALPAGVYYMYFRTAQGSSTARVVKFD